MGFEAGFSSRMRNKENKKIDLVYLGNPGNTIDRLIIRHASKGDEKIEGTQQFFDEETKTFHEELCLYDNEDYEYNMSKKQLQDLFDKVYPIYQVLAKYSDRVISELSEYLEGYDDKPKEVKSVDLSLIKDLLYNLGADINDIELYKFYRLCVNLLALQQLDDSLIENVIYWRSY